MMIGRLGLWRDPVDKGDGADKVGERVQCLRIASASRVQPARSVIRRSTGLEKVSSCSALQFARTDFVESDTGGFDYS